MLIGLINPNKAIKEPAIHLGLGYLAAYALLENPNYRFKLLDTRVATSAETAEYFRHPFDVIGITASSQVYEEALELGAWIKKQYPNTPLVIGGSHASTVREEVLYDSPFDYAVYGEGEQTFNELLTHLKAHRPVDSIQGLIYRENAGKITCNPPRSVIHDIDSIPFPDFSLFPMDRYPQHRMTTSRGCPYDCVFCNSRSIWTNKWRKRSAENVLEEIRYLVKTHALKSFVFNDDSFNMDLDRVETICDALIQQKPQIIWTTSIRADRITPLIAGKMKKAGCYSVSIGIESANDEVLKKMKKHTTREKIYQGIQILRQAGLDVTGQFMIGNPGDTLETVKESIEFARTSNLSGVEFYTALPYKDSLLYDFVMQHGSLLTDEPSYRYHLIQPRIVYETPEFSYQERLEAIELARQNGYYHALSTDRRIKILDMGKSLTKISQRLLGPSLGNKLYLMARKVYRQQILKKLS